ncbi:MAG TPA: CRTAC1 family protein [Thermoanaerobaculia bacterium]|nr:CRTAC1 family protein [Thermoanaerobaculia bacterium]
MDSRPSFVRRHALKLAALAAIVAAYGFARLPVLSEREEAALAGRFAFTRFDLPFAPVSDPRKTIRAVHPQLARISAWISSVGAGVATHDLDGDGLANDLCSIDNGTDRVVVMPAPGTGERYPSFVLEATGLPYDRATTAPMGCLPGDYNEDGLADVAVYYWGRSPVLFLARSGSPAPLAAERYRPRELVTPAEDWYSNAATRADFDGDGHIDLVIGNYFPEDSRIIDERATNRAYMQRSMSRAANGGKDRLLLWRSGRAGSEPEAQFQDVPGALPGRAEVGWTLAMGAADLDGDLLPELYIGNDFGPDVLLHNRSRPGAVSLVAVEGRKGFTTPASKVLGHDSFKGMGVDFADLNEDGFLDVYVSNIAAEYSLEESHFVWTSTGRPADFRSGRAPYVDRSEPLGLARSGWGWDCRFADFDNDGVVEAVQATGFLRGEKSRWPELHEIAMGNDQLLHHPGAWPQIQAGDDLSGHQHNPFFVRAPSGRYFDLASALGMADPMVSRGIAVADVDGDADLDFVVANQWEHSYLYRNDAPRAGKGLVLDLRLPVADGSGSVAAVGAQARVRLPDGRTLLGEVDGGSGHSGKRSPEVHFGLGAVAGPVAVEVTFRGFDGTVRTQTFTLEAGRHTLLLGVSVLGATAKES